MKRAYQLSTVLISSLILLTQTKIAYAAELCPPGFTKLCDISFQRTGGSTLVGNIVTVLLILAVVLSLIFLVYGGIKYIISGGDKAKVDAARSHITAAIVGLILAFVAYLILNLIGNLFGINVTSLKIPTLVP